MDIFKYINIFVYAKIKSCKCNYMYIFVYM